MIEIILLSIFSLNISVYATIDWGDEIYVSSNMEVDAITINGSRVSAYYAPRSTVSNYDSSEIYSCAAFVKRFYRLIFGVNVDNLFSGRKPNVDKGTFVLTTNPQIGDIAATINHWAIVRFVSGNAVTLIEQNAWDETYTKACKQRKLISESTYQYWHWTGNSGISEDSEAEAIQLWGIENNATFSGKVQFWAKRFDNDSNHYARFYIDDIEVTGNLYADNGGFFSFPLDTSKYANGSHIIRVKYANSLLAAEDSRTINFNNVIKFFDFWGIDDNAIISGNDKIWLKSENYSSNSCVQICVDDTPYIKLKPDNSGFYSFELNSYNLGVGVHFLSAILYDGAYLVTVKRTITVSNDIYFDFWGTENNASICNNARIFVKQIGFKMNVNIYIDKSKYTQIVPDTDGLCSFIIDTCKYDLGEHLLTAKANYNGEEIIAQRNIFISDNKHIYSDWKIVRQSTCNKTGNEERTCISCQKKETKVIPKIDHQWSPWNIQLPTVLENGRRSRKCMNCDLEELILIKKISPTMKLSMKKILLKKGQNTTKFKVSDLSRGDKVISYTSNKPNIVSVTSNGTLRARKIGSALITVTLISGKKAQAIVKVQKGTVKTSKISVKERNVSLKKGKKYQIKASVSPLTSQEKVIYSTSNKKIATVDKKGKVVAKKKGKAVITVKSGKKKIKVKITVK